MDNLLKNRTEALDRAVEKGKKKRKIKDVSYSVKGKRLRGKAPLWLKILIAIVCIPVCLGMIIYIPPIFYSEPTGVGTYIVSPDTKAIKVYQTYIKDNPDSDFDEDGLTNHMEEQYGTNVWDIDTDNDSVSDYAELFVTETSPVDASDVLIKQVQEEDSQKGDTVKTPYKIDDIIFWPDDYSSKAYGAVVRTLKGFRFCNYSGWIKFPVEAYAYGYANGVHYELPHMEENNAWRITSSDEVLLYGEKLTFVNELTLPFIGKIYLKDTTLPNFLSEVFPKKGGPVTCRRIADIDINPDTGQDTVTTPTVPDITSTQEERVTSDTNTLKDLTTVRWNIENGHCVAVSMYSGNGGEAVGVIYGYDAKGNLLVADLNLEPLGKIEIRETAKRMMNKDGTIGQVSKFIWRGFGFSSEVGDRINFFAVSN